MAAHTLCALAFLGAFLLAQATAETVMLPPARSRPPCFVARHGLIFVVPVL